MASISSTQTSEGSGSGPASVHCVASRDSRSTCGEVTSPVTASSYWVNHGGRSAWYKEESDVNHTQAVGTVATPDSPLGKLHLMEMQFAELQHHFRIMGKLSEAKNDFTSIYYHLSSPIYHLYGYNNHIFKVG